MAYALSRLDSKKEKKKLHLLVLIYWKAKYDTGLPRVWTADQLTQKFLNVLLASS